MYKSLVYYGVFLGLATSHHGRHSQSLAVALAIPTIDRFVIPRGGVRTARPVKRIPSFTDHTGQNDTQPFFIEQTVPVVEEEANHEVSKVSPDSGVTNKPSFVAESLSGMTVALASIPSGIAYAAIAGLDPLVGIWSSVVLGAVSSLTGMRAGVIAGSASVVAVPLASIISNYGVMYMCPTVFLAGVMELVFSLAKGGKFINLVSDSVMTGFLNGLGFLLLKSQLKVFISPGNGNFLSLLPQGPLLATVGVTALTSALSLVLPKVLPGQGWPVALLSIVFSTIVAQVLNLPVAKLSLGGGDGDWRGLLPSFVGLPSGGESLLSLNTLRIVGGAAFSIAIISILETLLSSKVLDEAVAEKSSDPKATLEKLNDDRVKDKSCMAMAIGNMASAIFGGFGGCGLIPQTLLNFQTGGRGVASVLSYSAIMAASVLFFSSLINKVPMASLAGVMLMVAFRTIQWKPTAKSMAGAWTSIANSDKGRLESDSHSEDLVKFISVAVSSVFCMSVDMATGIILGVVLEKGLPLLFARGSRKFNVLFAH